MGTTEPVTPEVDPLKGTRYRSKGILGRGAMGEVHLAEHTSLGKIVVAKLLHRELSGRPDLADRMRIEAQSLARLSHPGLVQVQDFGETPEGRPYLIMERLVGHSLRQEFHQRGALPIAEAVEITIQMLAGLGAAHEVGLVHRDVKLDNVFICPQVSGQPVVKVIDFGIAKVLPSAKPGDAPAPLAFPTEDGMTVGTPRFLSPEQARGKPVDARADIYGAGVVLYTLVAGRGPFDHAQGLVELIRAQALEPPTAPSRYAAQGLPAALDMVILKSLEKDPDKRFPSTQAFIDALRWSLTAVVPDPPPPRPPAMPRDAKLPDSQTYRSQYLEAQPEPEQRRVLPQTPPIVPAAGRPASEPPVQPAPPDAPVPFARPGTGPKHTVRMADAAVPYAALPRPRTLQSAQDQARVQEELPPAVGVAIAAPPRARTLQSANPQVGHPGQPGVGAAGAAPPMPGAPATPPHAMAANAAGHAGASRPSPAPLAPVVAPPRAPQGALVTQRPRRRRNRNDVVLAVAVVIVGMVLSLAVMFALIRVLR